MEHIIQQIVAAFVKKATEYLVQHGIGEIGKMSEDMLEMSKDAARELMAAFIKDADEALVGLKEERRADGLSVHERGVPRTVYTSLGPVTYRRTYFKTNAGMGCLLDGVLGVGPYERIDRAVSADMVDKAGRMSFGRAADMATGGGVSRQTAHRKAMGCGEVAMAPKKAARASGAIHIFADEDHVSMQDGSGAILPLITVCSGKERVSEGRNELTDRVHINCFGLSPEKRWEYAYAVCEEMFGMDREVYIYGDGAPWISASDACFPGAVHVLDAQHYRQRMTGILAGDICSRYTLRLYGAVKGRDKEAFGGLLYEIMGAVMQGMPECGQRKARLKAVRESGAYILGNWGAVMNMGREGSIGSCTEALVSHVLSERFSRSPMGWSKAGLGKMSMIRVFVENGGRVMPEDIGAGRAKGGAGCAEKARIERYEGLIRRQQDEVFEGMKDWSVFVPEGAPPGAPSGTKTLIDALGRMRGVV